MENDIVTLSTYSNLSSAYMAKNFLELNDIQSFIADENITVADPLYMNAVGGIRLTVFEKDVPKALELLKQQEEEIPEEIPQQEQKEKDPNAVLCPKCGSDDTRRENVSPVAFGLSLLLLFGFPIPFIKRKYHCFHCQHEWK
ncbi:MAG: hypothetical protein JWP12_3040 [Bacteroidetes bacterium]|nr:hypothetical protein [Bacteroidota bacterium]